MNVALYARVSTEKQAENDLSITAQLKALRDFSRKRGWHIYREFIDEAESARSANRPAFQEMIAFGRKKIKPFEVILVWKHSRFARNREDAIVYKSLLRRHGISVVSINEPIENSSSGKLLEGMIEVIDEFYSLNLAEDTIRGMRENANRGFQNGSIPIGYRAKRVPDGATQRTKLEPDDVYASIIKRIFDWALAGKGIKSIAQTLNAEGIKTNRGRTWTTTTIRYILDNETYSGTLIYGRRNNKPGYMNNPPSIIRIEGNHPSIVSPETYAKVKKMMRRFHKTTRHPREISSQYLLSGILYCEKCGMKMTGTSAKSGTYHYYACHNYLKRGKTTCNMRLFNKHVIEALVLDRLATHVLTKSNLLRLHRIILRELKSHDAESINQLAALNMQLDKLHERLEKLYTALELGKLDIDDLAPRIKELKAQIEALESQRLNLTTTPADAAILPFNERTIGGYLSDLKHTLKQGSFKEQKDFLRSFIRKIIVGEAKIVFEYTIPFINRKTEPRSTEVLSMDQIGSPSWTRTSNPWINSPMLYH